MQLSLSSCSFIASCLFFLQLALTILETQSASSYGVHYLTHQTFILVYQFSLSRLLFPYASLTFLLFAVCFLMISLLLLPDITGTISIFFVLFLVTIMLCFTCYSVENFIRRRWIMEAIVEKEREKIGT